MPSESPTENSPRPQLKAIAVGDALGWSIEPASPRREWMDAIPHGFAYRCLPLVIGNQAGWVIRCPAAFEALWNGSPDMHAVALRLDTGSERYKPVILSHFGHGIITFSLPWLFKTSPGYGLLVRGPTNSIKQNISALDAFVETDWSPFTFTMNWKIHKPGVPVRFEANEVVCHILPFAPESAERCSVSYGTLDEEPDLKRAFEAWRQSRNTFNARPDRTAEEWQKGYMRGQTPDGTKAENHRSNLKLARFDEPTTPGNSAPN